MFAPSQRISASSTNSIRKLSKTSRSLTSPPGSSVPPAAAAAAPPPGAPPDATASRPNSTRTARLAGDCIGRGSGSAGRERAGSLVIGILPFQFGAEYVNLPLRARAVEVWRPGTRSITRRLIPRNLRGALAEAGEEPGEQRPAAGAAMFRVAGGEARSPRVAQPPCPGARKRGHVARRLTPPGLTRGGDSGRTSPRLPGGTRRAGRRRPLSPRSGPSRPSSAIPCSLPTARLRYAARPVPAGITATPPPAPPL